MTFKDHRIPISLACALVASMAAMTLSAQKAAKRPSLVVGIVIKGLDIDQIYQLRGQFCQNGFNRLLNKGIVMTGVDYGSHLDDAASTAVIYTGASPAVNGIPSSTLFDIESRRKRPTLLDNRQIGNFTNETLSPAALRVSTLSDEIKIDAGGLGSVYTIAPDATQAIIMTGHAGNSACWITDDTGKWATTAYYKELPSVIQSINHRSPLSARLDTLSWSPAAPPEAFEFLPSYKRIYPFRHTFPRNDSNRYISFKSSAPVNTEVTTIAGDYLKSLNLGRREPVDMLNLSYTLQPYCYSRDPDTRAELLDSYIKLDRQLDRLFRSIDISGPGMDNTLVFIAGTPVSGNAQKDDEKWQIPSGEFSAARAVSLLKMNLMSIYGNGDWVSGYHNKQIFLNRNLIKERGKDLKEFREESADFLRRMSGVTFAATIDEVMSSRGHESMPFPEPRNIDIDTAGDIFLSIAPGWEIIDETASSSPAISVERADGSISAAFILYPTIEPQTITTTVDARVIAPTITRILRIRSPNGSRLQPLRF